MFVSTQKVDPLKGHVSPANALLFLHDSFNGVVMQTHTDRALGLFETDLLQGRYVDSSQIAYFGVMLTYLNNIYPLAINELSKTDHLPVSRILPEYLASISKTGEEIEKLSDESVLVSSNRSLWGRYYFGRAQNIILGGSDTWNLTSMYNLDLYGAYSPLNVIQYYFQSPSSEATKDYTPKQNTALNNLLGMIIETVNTNANIPPGSILEFLKKINATTMNLCAIDNSELRLAKTSLYALEISTWINNGALAGKANCG